MPRAQVVQAGAKPKSIGAAVVGNRHGHESGAAGGPRESWTIGEVQVALNSDLDATMVWCDLN